MKIDEAAAREFATLSRQGVSYREIARRFGVDWRTVKSRIGKVQTVDEGRRLDNAFRDVYSGLLREHLMLLVQVASGILRAVQTQPLFSQPDQDAQLLLERLREIHLDEALADLRPRGLDLDASPSTSLPDVVGAPAKGRMIRRLVSAVEDHEPELGVALDDWVRSWRQFQAQRREFGDQAERLMKLGLPEDLAVASSVGRGLAEGLLQAELLGQKMHPPRIKERSGGRASLVLQVDVRRAQLGVGTTQIVEQALSATQTVLLQLKHDGRLRPVRTTYAAVLTKIEAVQDLVDSMVLRGFPKGSCSLCVLRARQDL